MAVADAGHPHRHQSKDGRRSTWTAPLTSSSSLNFIPTATSSPTEKSAPSPGCSTPKAQRFRIPEILTCPPAPKKRRIVSNCSLQRTPIAFFAPPDIELFFFFALRDVSN
ncbi:cyclin-dependent protein kinase inhibitor SMR9-like [Cornus florida]|uniref:cyclin-dependent protein kinase inhibitor SMR9-like n=1 Tax=Cornus florida TaxID=4283 RepID=UPI0028971394|nr:cyclin-dependent protein kinase inhibitor SMR9-like [Cornus florida]